MRNLRVVVLLLACVLFTSGCDWLMFGGNPGRTGAQFEPGFSDSAIPGLQASTVASVPLTGQVVVHQGLIFVTSDGTLTAYDAATYAAKHGDGFARHA